MPERGSVRIAGFGNVMTRPVLNDLPVEVARLTPVAKTGVYSVFGVIF
jgi:hypothetical protein